VDFISNDSSNSIKRYGKKDLREEKENPNKDEKYSTLQ
tara:strand:+ start:429 stop:542 length:114 start_codon:yes stop_codon:yes gene_type:complete